MLKYVLAVLVVLVLLATVLWGFPDAWALVGIVPAFVLGATIAHLRRPPEPDGKRQIRPGVLVLGGMFGLVTGAAALIVMWAAAAPSRIVIETSLPIETASDKVWAEVGDPYRRTTWDLWVKDLEPIGRANKMVEGAEYNSVLLLERYEVPGVVQTVTDLEPGRLVTWRFKATGWTLENLEQTVTLEKQGEQLTLATYRLSYDVPTVLGRVGERIAVRGAVTRMTEETLKRLRAGAMGIE